MFHALIFAAASNGLVDTFLARISDNGVPQRAQRTITVGALPPGWNSPVPLPAGVTVVGSVLTPKYSTELFFQPSDAAKAAQAYIAQLRAAGFSDKLGVVGHSGFGFSQAAMNLTVMCGAQQAVDVAQPAQDDLRVTIADLAMSPCQPQPSRTISPLPDLNPPPDTQIVGSNGGGTTSFGPTGTSSVSSSAGIESPVPLTQIFASFASQMRAANWQPQRGLITAQGGVQTFRYQRGSATWRATLIMVPASKPHSYEARIEATGTPQIGQQAVISPERPAPQLRRSDAPAALQLIENIVSDYGVNGSKPTLYVRATPPELDKRIPLPAAHLLGSLRARDMVTLYYQATRAGYDAYLARLQRDGWSPLPTGLPHVGGFATQFGNFSTFCKDGMPSLSVRVRPNSNDVAISPGPVVSKCEAAVPPSEPPQPAPLPELKAPAQATMRSGSAGFIGGSNGAAITTTDSLADVLADFAAQMQAGKWSAQTPVQNDAVGSQTFSYTDAQGARWQSVLTLYRSQADSKTYYAFIDVTRLP